MSQFSAAAIFGALALAAATANAAPTTTVVPVDPNPSSAPWNAPSTATKTPAIIFFTIGGLIVLAQVIYIVWYRAHMIANPLVEQLMHNDSTIDMESGTKAADM